MKKKAVATPMAVGAKRIPVRYLTAVLLILICEAAVIIKLGMTSKSAVRT